jgi:hypothetical protein
MAADAMPEMMNNSSRRQALVNSITGSSQSSRASLTCQSHGTKAMPQ